MTELMNAEVSERAPVDWCAEETRRFEEVQVGDTVWPDLGRVGDWPCYVLAKDDVAKLLFLEATFDDPCQNVFMGPLWLVADSDLEILDSSQNRSEAEWCYSTPGDD